MSNGGFGLGVVSKVFFRGFSGPPGETKVPLDVVEDFCLHAWEVRAAGEVEDVRAFLRTLVVRIETEDHRGRIIHGFP